MPTTMLTLAWLLATTTHLAAFAPSTQLDSLTTATLVARMDQPVLAAPLGTTDPERAEWLLYESESDEETEDGEAIGTVAPPAVWITPPTPFGAVVSNPHPTILPRSALRSPTLRC